MKISISKAVLLSKLAQLAKVAGSKVIPILDDVLFEMYPYGLEVTAGNGEISVKSSFHPDDVKAMDTGKVTVPAKKFHEIVKKMGDTIEIESKGLKVIVKSGGSKYELTGQDPEMYPSFPDTDGDTVKILGADFKEMIKRTFYAASTNENTPILQGIKLRIKASQMTATACDRHRLAIASYNLKQGFTDVIAVVNGDSLHKKVIGVIEDKEEIELTFNDSRMIVKTNDYTIASRILEGNYPATDKLVPDSFKTSIDVDVSEFKSALERALVVALDDKTNILKMVVASDLLITAESENNTASETVDAKIQGDPLTLSYNGKYMVDALSTVTDTKKVKLCLNGPMEPIILKTDSSDDIQLVLPYRTR